MKSKASKKSAKKATAAKKKSAAKKKPAQKSAKSSKPRATQKDAVKKQWKRSQTLEDLPKDQYSGTVDDQESTYEKMDFVNRVANEIAQKARQQSTWLLWEGAKASRLKVVVFDRSVLDAFQERGISDPN